MSPQSLNGMWLRFDSKTIGGHNIICLKEIGLHAPKHDNYSRLNSQHNWGGGLHDEHKNLRFDMNKVFIYTSLQTMRKVAIDLIRIC